MYPKKEKDNLNKLKVYVNLDVWQIGIIYAAVCC